MALVGAWTTTSNLKAFMQMETNPATQLQTDAGSKQQKQKSQNYCN